MNGLTKIIDWIRGLLAPEWTQPPTREEVQALARDASEEVVSLAKAGKRVYAIKAYRQETGASLKDAHAVVTWLTPAQPRA